MNDPNWNGASFIALIERLRRMGVDAELPKPGQGPDSYTAQLMGYLLDAAGKPIDPVYIDPMFRPMRTPLTSEPIQTPRAHVNEGGRSYRIEGAIQDGQVYKPGEPLPPVKHEGGQ